MGMQDEPASGDHRADWDYEWTFKPVAWDIDGDGKAEIVTLAKRDGKYQYVVLKDEGSKYRILASFDSPIPVGDDQNNSRHFPFFAYLGGPYYSLMLQGGNYHAWDMWAYDFNGSGFTLRWHVKSTGPKFSGNRSGSHTILVADLDGDGRDEICNGLTMLGHDGSVRWSGNAEFGNDVHVDGQVIDDILPSNPGLELMTHAETGKKYALYDARSGKCLWVKEAAEKHLQLNIAANISGGPGLDIFGVTGGHKATGVFACTCDGHDIPYPFPERPRNGDRWWPMDWDGGRGHNVCLNFKTIYGEQAKVLYKVDLSDAPDGNVVPWNEHDLYHLWFNVDLVGDYREDIPIQMRDGSIRVYLNTQTPPAKRRSKWQNPAYQMMQAPGDYRYFIAALNEPESRPAAARSAAGEWHVGLAVENAVVAAAQRLYEAAGRNGKR